MTLHRKDVVGLTFVVVGLAVIALAWSTPFLPDSFAIKILEVLMIIAASVLGGVLAWIGYQLMTTPPPKPVEELEKELRDEIEQIKKEVLQKLRDRSQG